MERIRAGEDFDAARFRAFRRAISNALTRRAGRLLALDTVLDAAGAEGRSFGGEHEIPVDHIVGSAASVSKAGDFDPGFLPVNRRLRDRWTRVYTAMVEGGELPPIDVYRVGDGYYVIDGHHRVSVARSLGRDTINARVIDVKTRAPLTGHLDAEELLKAAEYAQFLETTQ
ncbi:MAG TPA: ParB/RepB/Spo0J family partition protein, partial [Candidatus Dormibacteraeota bacterium]|nr:ParB/RepB/Spo0J family partition protein [Candidatus Dormibacteraeota bacterium]